MKNWPLSLALALVAATSMVGCSSGGMSPIGMAHTSVGKFKAKTLKGENHRFSRHHLVVKMAPGAKSPVEGTLIKQSMGDRQLHQLPGVMTVDQAMSAYQSAPGVLGIERLELIPMEDEPVAPPQVPMAPAPNLAANDSLYFQQWSHAVTNIPAAWEATRGRNEVIVGVLDTGVDYTHPDLAGQVINGPDFAENTNDSRDIDEHGTHVAGIIAANANNNLGVAGIAPNAKILALKIFEPYMEDGKFQGTFYNAFTLARAVQYAATTGKAKIINISAGIADDELVETMFAMARGKGVIICVSAGNNGNNVYTGGPKSMDGVLAVHATDSSDRLARFSNYGNSFGVSAPGMAIMSTVPTYPNKYTGEAPSRTGYESMSGTSMASPFVAGLAALVVSSLMDSVERNIQETMGQTVKLNPTDIPGTVVEDLLRSTCKDLGRPGRDDVFGAGRVDAARALAACAAPNWVERTTKEVVRNRRR